MSKLTVGVVDYGVGNHASVRQCLYHLGLRCRISDDTSVLASCQLLLLPGVGAFGPAMSALKAKSLDRFLLEQADRKMPILGICLGMQLLTESSREHGYSEGLGLIPGEVVALNDPLWHIGWNTIERPPSESRFTIEYGQAFYFNHSYAYQGPEEFQIGVTTVGTARFGSIIGRDGLVGVQFHPEKSQLAGHAFLRQIVQGLCGT